MNPQQVGPYRILSQLGKGGMGEVYLAQDTRLDRVVALKILPTDAASNQDRIQRFIREAKAASALNHPNVATIYDVGESDGTRFIAMEYVEGQTLAGKIGGKLLPATEAIEIAIQIADALSAAQSKGITHRDIKPANLMITPRGQVKVLDFGLAKVLSGPDLDGSLPTVDRTVAGQVLGTFQYMSPEQILGQELDPRTDIYSFGIVMYEMVTGGHPVTHTNATVPMELDRIIRKCLVQERERRYQTADEILVDLKNLRRDSTNAATVSPITREPSAPKRTARLALTAAVLLLALGIAVLVLVNRKSAEAIESVAVLPLANMGANSDAQYVADGISDSIISNLSQFSRLRVMSRSSTLRFKGHDVDPQTAGRELKVQSVITGQVTPRGDQVTISLELIDVRDNRQIWGHQYNENLADLFRLQSEISQDISDNLRLQLTGQERQEMAKRSTENGEAYQLYLKGRFYSAQLSADGINKGIQYFNEALEKDPRYALAYVGLANSHILLGSDSTPPREAMPKARDYAMKALELNGSLQEAHASLGIIKLIYEWNFKEAEKELRNSLALSPQSLETFSCALHYADPIGRNSQAIADIKRALELDPISIISNLELGCASYYGRQFDQSVNQFHKTLTLDPTSALGFYGLGRAYSAKGMYQEVIKELGKAAEMTNRWPPIVSELGYAYARLGNKSETNRLLQELKDQRMRRYVDAPLLASVYVALNDDKQAMDWLEKAYDERSLYMPWLRVEPKWDPLRDDPRFRTLMQHVGFTP